MNDQIFFIFADNILAGIAAFIAIVVWVKTRDISWVFIVIAVIIFYASVIHKTLMFFGIVVSNTPVDMLFTYTPLILMIIALTLKAVRNMRR